MQTGLQILIPDVGPEVVLAIRVMDYDLIGKDELMGEYEMILNKDNEEAAFLRDSSEAFPLTCPLLPGRKKGTTRKTGKPRGELNLTLQYTPFFNASAAQAATGEKGEEDPAKAMEAAAVRLLHLPFEHNEFVTVYLDVRRAAILPTRYIVCPWYTVLMVEVGWKLRCSDIVCLWSLQGLFRLS